MGVAMALLSALSYGISDVIGGLAARRASPLRVAMIGQLGGLGVTAVVLLIEPRGVPAASDLAWGAYSGIGTGLAMAFLFRGLSRGAMSVVVPLSSVGGVALPVLVGALVLGDRPPGLTWVGVLIALPALWFLSKDSGGSTSASRVSVIDGLAASGGIAIQYLCLAQANSYAGLYPILSGRVAAIATILIAAITFMRTPTRSKDTRVMTPALLALSIGAGALAATALGAYLFALRTELVAVAVVLSSLYPVVPVLVGLVLLDERLRVAQAIGLVAALVATVIIVAS